MPVGAVVGQPQRGPSRLAEKRTFRPPFRYPWGSGQSSRHQAGPPHRAVGGQLLPVDPHHLVVLEQPCRQISWNTPASPLVAGELLCEYRDSLDGQKGGGRVGTPHARLVKGHQLVAHREIAPDHHVYGRG